LAVVLAACCMLNACNTPQGNYDEGSSIPWNAPEQWEQRPNTSAPLAW